jgi:Mlc titration factor MtfA (ptsG expression regulator)
MFKRWRRRRILERHFIPDEQWSALVGSVPALARLSQEHLSRLRTLTLLFLHEKQFEAARGLLLDEAKCLRIAALACLPILELGFDAYRLFKSVVVHPDEFVVRDRTYEDEDGVVHTGDDVLSGEAHAQGPVVLAWSEVEQSGRGEGFNVVVHECVHKLDMLGGEPDGVPPLHGDMRVPEWVAAFDAAYDDLCDQLDRGEEPWLDPYAEMFFDVPQRMRVEYPDVYEQLKRYFKQDPASSA